MCTFIVLFAKIDLVFKMECLVSLRRVSRFAVVLVCLWAVVPRGGGGESASGLQPRGGGEESASGLQPEKTQLFFSYITTKTGSFVAAGAIPAMDLALRLINDRTDILPNYTLGYTEILDSGVDLTNLYSHYLLTNCISFWYMHHQSKLMSRYKYQFTLISTCTKWE